MASNTNNFSFSSATFDYTLEKSDTEGSTMHVKETLVAEFPDYNQNHGIERYIPYTNKGGQNLTIQNQSALDLKVLRNDLSEPFTVGKDNGYYYARIGDAKKYVTGKQTYTLDYNFSRVITEYDNTENQELYWDTNGTGWSQKFKTLTANVHIPKDANVVGTSCYVGVSGAKGKERCKTTKTSDGYSFTTENLSAGENLTFDLEFPKNTFHVPPKPTSYALIIIFGIEVFFITLFSLLLYKNLWLKVKGKYRWYKNAPVPPQYTPLKGYTVADLSKIYLKKTSSDRVATFLELVVSKKVSLVKGEKHKLSNRYHWNATINSLDDLTADQLSVLKTLNAGSIPPVGKTIEIKKQTYNAALEIAYREYDFATEASLQQKGDLLPSPIEDKLDKLGKKTKGHHTSIFGIAFCVVFMIFMIITFIAPGAVNRLLDAISENLNPDHYIIFASWLSIPAIILPIIALIVHIAISSKLSPYKRYTDQGLEHSNYLEGLKLYIKMAEADRLKFLQSVEGADTSNAGIVKLYEKLLPYAVLFGLEKSWLSEMERYYKLEDIVEPDWYDVGLAYALSSNTFSSSLSRPVDPSSSSSSGGGGGGSSGGGGGGGGGGGW